MANNKMLIDASHPEETRVVVVRGNRIEEFDFEAQDRRQLRGNIYLAKVTRVEPSLQAAFIDYGGNRHGFLAFSEIHPDYYQIPAADRQALLDAEAEAANVEDDDQTVGIEEAASSGNEEEVEDDAPKKKRRKPRRSNRGRKARVAEAESENGGAGETAAEETEVASGDTGSAEQKTVSDSSSSEEQAEEKPKPKKRARRPRKTKASKEDETAENVDETSKEEVEAEAVDSDVDETESGKTMAAMMAMDVISEEAPEEEPLQDTADEAPEEAPAEKPKRKTVRRKSTTAKSAATKTKKADTKSEDASSRDAEAVEESAEEEKPKRKTTRRKSTAKKKVEDKDAETSEDSSEETSADAGEELASDEKPKKRARNGRRRKAKADICEENTEEEATPDGGSQNGDDEENGKDVESVGQEDALEEVSVKRPRRQYKIQEVIRRRQVMLVQVVKEERGNKGAALTTYLSLAGRYSVLMPNTARGGGISRKITNPADRKRLKEVAGSLDVPAGMGVILRTAGAARDKEEIERDFDYLMRLWENVRELTLESSAPFLVYEEGSLIKRSIRDLYNKDIGEIIVSGEEGYREAKDFMRMLMPGHGRNVKLYKGEQPLLSKYNIESQLDKMVTPQVTLKSGGYLIINQTEALVAIDVNSGRSTREHSIEATALQTNLEAAEEVARQLRLRDLAGLVVIDFIDMEEKRNNRAVERKLKECLKSDRARIQVGHISHFGLLEMSRQRIRASVLESTMAVCPTCQGVGHVRSEPSFGLHILRGIDDHLIRNSRNDITVKVPPSIALYLLNNKRAAVTELEDRHGVKITFESDPSIEGQEFVIEKGEPTSRSPRKAAAINPMNVDDRAEESGEDASTEASPSEDDDDDREGNKRNRKRRGRGRGKNRGSDEDVSEAGDERPNEASPASTEVDSTEEKPDSYPEEEPKTAKRGRRAGAKAAKKKEEVPASDLVEEETEEETEPATPRRRTGRPGKKMKPAETAETDNKQEEEVSAKPKTGSAPPRKVRRRNTRRVAEPKEETPKGEEDGEPASWGGGFLS